jgi:hypothetical protein
MAGLVGQNALARWGFPRRKRTMLACRPFRCPRADPNRHIRSILASDLRRPVGDALMASQVARSILTRKVSVWVVPRAPNFGLVRWYVRLGWVAPDNFLIDFFEL